LKSKTFSQEDPFEGVGVSFLKNRRESPENPLQSKAVPKKLTHTPFEELYRLLCDFRVTLEMISKEKIGQANAW